MPAKTLHSIRTRQSTVEKLTVEARTVKGSLQIKIRILVPGTWVEVVKRTRKRNQTTRVDTIVSSALSRNNPVSKTEV